MLKFIEYSTRGHKGAKSRSGYSKKIGFEGGQQPLQRRVPKFGFTNPNRVEYNCVNIDTIQAGQWAEYWADSKSPLRPKKIEYIIAIQAESS